MHAKFTKTPSFLQVPPCFLVGGKVVVTLSKTGERQLDPVQRQAAWQQTALEGHHRLGSSPLITN